MTTPKRPTRGGNSFSTLYEKNKLVFQIGGGILALLFTILLYTQSSSSITNLINVGPDSLKEALMGDSPYVFYCMKGNNKRGEEEKVHPLFQELNTQRGSKYGFASLNCSQLLPSGVSIAKRFDINQKIRPTIFITAPWLGGRAKQLQGMYLSLSLSLSASIHNFIRSYLY